jgi:hypothetical protein
MEAHEFCRYLGGRLPEPQDVNMVNGLSGIAAEYLGDQEIWIGYNDELVEGR